MKYPVIMAVSNDKYQLPLAIADSPYDMARMRCVQYKSVLKALEKSDRGEKSSYIRVWIDIDDAEYAEIHKKVVDARLKAGLAAR